MIVDVGFVLVEVDLVCVVWVMWLDFLKVNESDVLVV